MTSETPVVTTTTEEAEVTPYEGMPCGYDDFGKVSADGTLRCSALEGAWIDRTNQTRSAVPSGAACSEPGARARIEGTEAIATCQSDGSGDYTWQY